MLNKIRRWIGTPFIFVLGIIFGLLLWLFYGREDLLRFCGWLDEQAKTLAAKERRDV